MRPKLAERHRARELRARGWPLRRIAAELGVALSSVSAWTRDVNRLQPLRTLRLPVMSGRTRRCPRCRRTWPVEFFSRRGGNGRQHWCKECFRAYFRTRGDTHRAQVARAKAQRKTAARAAVLEYLRDRSCSDCGDDRLGVLEFDHVRGTKRANVSNLVAIGSSVARLAAEIANCEVVCVNCHRRRTAARAAAKASSRSTTGPDMRPGRDRNRAVVRSLLDATGCVDCGERDPIVLEFDHMGAKNFSISNAIAREYRVERLLAELAKCEIRCASCHRLRTAERGEHFRASSVTPP